MKQKFEEKTTSLIKNISVFFKNHTFIRCEIISLLVLIICETLCRHSFIDAVQFAFKSPYPFVYNYLIILFTTSIALFFSKEVFSVTIASAFWIILSLVNCIVLCFRLTPFSAVDFSIAINMLGIIDIYLNIFQLILIVVCIIAFIAVLVLIYRKTPSFKVNFLKCLVFFICVSLILTTMGVVGRKTGLLDRKFPNLAQAYDKYGFAYCFSLSIFDTGIQEPQEYAQETVEDILEKIGYGNDVPPIDCPNIIFVQLESFFDVNRAKNLIFTDNPLPNFTYLKENYPHGLITVSSIGGGTANTEFELLTGMNLEHFGPGEYPYKTILKSVTCENPAYTLKKYGYTSHAIHNHSATFYDRFQVYPMLGFDTFIPVEMMYDVEHTAFGWAKDKILTEHIFDCLNSTDNQDFIFTVSVQAHGKYPDQEMSSDKDIQVDLQNLSDAEKKAQMKYYIDQLNDTDAFVGDLISQLSDFNEPTVVLFYGDHFPTIYLEEDKLEGTKYQTDYVIWSNFDFYCENKDLMCYQLNAHLFEALGSNLGTMTKIHQQADKLDNYQKCMEMIEYDMLYGDMISYGHTNPYLPTNMEMGVFDIYVTDIVHLNGKLYVYGHKFNEHSRVKIDGKVKDTTYLSENCISIDLPTLDNYETLQVSQYTYDRIELRKSAEYEIVSFIDPIIKPVDLPSEQ